MSKFYLVDECTYHRMCQIMNGVACLTFSFSSTLILAVSLKVLMFTEK